jgi:hypothetical protein
MRAAELRPGVDDIIVGIDLAAREHQAVIVDAVDRRPTRFRVAHSREGIAELLRRAGGPQAVSSPSRPRGMSGRPLLPSSNDRANAPRDVLSIFLATKAVEAEFEDGLGMETVEFGELDGGLA